MTRCHWTLRDLELAHPESPREHDAHRDRHSRAPSAFRPSCPCRKAPGGHQQNFMPRPLSSRPAPARASSFGAIFIAGPAAATVWRLADAAARSRRARRRAGPSDAGRPRPRRRERRQNRATLTNRFRINPTWRVKSLALRIGGSCPVWADQTRNRGDRR